VDPLGPELGVFRIAVRATLPLCALPALATAPLVVRRLLQADDLTAGVVVVLLLLLPLSVLLMLAILWPLLRLFPVRVHELGLHGHDPYGRRLVVPWAQMGEIAPVSLLGMSYLKIATPDPKRTLWLPRFLTDPAGFDRLVTQQAGAAHPLVAVLG